MARLVALEGIDGSGKGTQARRLEERLIASGQKAALISFPRYQSTVWGRIIGDFLAGRYGPLEAVDPFLLALLYAGDRQESRGYLLASLQAHDVVVLDRYVASNIAHQGAKRDGAERRKLMHQIEQLEYGVHELPRPDVTILLDIPVLHAQKLIAQKAPRTYTDRQADEHEASAEYLERVAAVYRELAGQDSTWHTVACVADGRVRPVEEIADEIWAVVTSRGRSP